MQQGGRNRRRKRRFGSCLVLAAVMAAVPASALAAGPLAGETIVIDPGHGGIDGGATAYGRVEKAVTLPIGLDLSALLRGAGAHVVLTRTGDRFVSLADRVAIANAAGGDAFISIHANALSDPSYSGVTTFYGAASGFVSGVTRTPALVAASRALADDVETATQARSGEIDRGVQSADYYVLGNSHMPTILVETGFITNPVEGQRLTNPGYQETLAAGIAGGLAQFAANPNASGPSPTRDSGAATPAPGTEQYVVRPGDTLSAIAVHFGVDQASLKAANALSNGNRIYAGQTLSIAGGPGSVASGAAAPRYMGPNDTGGAGGHAYVVQQGDTLTAIARRLGTTVSAIAQANGIQNTDRLLAGQTLQLPGDGSAETGGTQTTTTATTTGGERYHIRPGDTLSAIALRLGISEQALATANQLSDVDHLVAGRYLQLPASD